MKVTEIPITIGARFRIYYREHRFSDPETAKFYIPEDVEPQPDERIGQNHTTIRIPQNGDIALQRYSNDELFRQVVKTRARRENTHPQGLMREYAGKEIRERNEVIGVGYREGDNRGTEGAKDTTNDTANGPATEGATNDSDDATTGLLSRIHQVISALIPK